MASVCGEVLSIIQVSSELWKSFSDAKDKIHDAYDVISRSQAQFELCKPRLEKLLDKKKYPVKYELTELRYCKKDSIRTD